MSEVTLADKVANALIPDAAENSPFIQPAVEIMRRSNGGLWVGGRVTLTSEAISFAPNALNLALQTGSLAWRIPLSDIDGVDVLPGLITSKVQLHTPHGPYQVRCYGAKKFAQQVRDAIAARPSDGVPGTSSGAW